jgi:hypothetical protein
MRRAAAVSLIIPAKHGKYVDEVLEIASLLLTDNDDMVRKGYGWLLKEASRQHPTEVFEYVMRNRTLMPRTALRYAIELMPKELKADAMRKEWQGQKKSRVISPKKNNGKNFLDSGSNAGIFQTFSSGRSGSWAREPHFSCC